MFTRTHEATATDYLSKDTTAAELVEVNSLLKNIEQTMYLNPEECLTIALHLSYVYYEFNRRSPKP